MTELDTCKCGDYRRDHVNGTGACKRADDLTHGFKPCKRFRLSTPDQPTGMNELREITDKFLADLRLTTRDFMDDEIPSDRAEVEYETAQEDAEAAIQEIVERCLTYQVNHIEESSEAYVRLSDIRHNLQQAGLLRGEDV